MENQTVEVIGFDNVKLIKPSDINPLYEAIDNLEKESSALQYSGNIDDKENIQSFINVQKQIKSFRATVKKSAKEFKKPYQEINKKIIQIEKHLLDRATQFFDDNEAKFSDYRKKQDAINKERQAKKDAKFNEKLAQAETGKADAELKLFVSKVYSDEKSRILEIQSKSWDALNLSLFYLTDYEKELASLEFETYVNTYVRADKSLHIKDILNPDAYRELEDLFLDITQKSLFAIRKDIKIKEEDFKKSLTTQQMNDKLTVATKEVVGTNAPIEIVSMKEPTNEVLLSYVVEQCKELQYMVNERISVSPMCSPEIYTINSLLKTIIKTK